MNKREIILTILAASAIIAIGYRTYKGGKTVTEQSHDKLPDSLRRAFGVK